LVDWYRFTASDFEYDKLSAHRVTFNEAVECFFSDFVIRRKQEVLRPVPVDWHDARRTDAQDHFPAQAGQRRSHHHRLAVMTTRKKRKTTTLGQEAIDRLVIAQSEDQSAWEPPVQVKKSTPASLSIPGDLAARAAFLARLHREGKVDKWVERVIRERVELEELAFAEVKKQLAS
jgi:hypothetical protein